MSSQDEIKTTDVTAEENDVKITEHAENLDTSTPWQEDKSVPACLLYVYENSLWTDVTLECTDENGDKEFIKAHKMVLASRSKVFEAMLFGPAAEKGEIIQITSFSYELMNVLVRYLYADETDLTEDTAIKTYRTAHFFQVPALLDECSQYIQSTFSDDNICEIMDLALQYDDVGLRDAASDYIDQNASKVIETEGFLRVSQRCLEYMFKGDTFHVDEKTIFRRAIEWATLHEDASNPDKDKTVNVDEETKSDITVTHFRNALGNAFKYIRLGALSFPDFSECAGSTLDGGEIKDILQFANDCSAEEFHQARLPKKEIIEIKRGMTNACFNSNAMQSRYYIYARNDIICEGMDLSAMTVDVNIAPYTQRKTVSPNCEFSFNLTIEVSRLNYIFETTIPYLSSNIVMFESPMYVKSSSDPYILVVTMEFNLKLLNFTISTSNVDKGSAEIGHAQVYWPSQISIAHKLRFSNMSNRDLKDRRNSNEEDEEDNDDDDSDDHLSDSSCGPTQESDS